MYKKRWSIFFILITLITRLSFADSVIRKLNIDAKGEGFFKNVTDMVVIDDKLFLADFSSNEVFSYQFEGINLIYLRSIGHQGQGPGDVQKPLALSVHKDHIAIKDQESISIFNLEGEFINKFRQFSTLISFQMARDHIYYLSTNPSDRYSINVFNFEGKWLSNLLEKKLWAIDGEITPLESFKELLIYSGQIWLDENYLYYISRHFGFIEKYSLSGELVLRKDLSRDLGENARIKVELNKKELLQRDELRLNKGKPKCYELFLDSYFEGGNLYLLMSQYDIANNKPITKIDIRCINSTDLSLSTAITADLKSKEWQSNLCVRIINKEPVFIIDISSEEGKDLYEIRNEK